MCTFCGCSDGAEPALTDLQTGVTVPLTDEHHHAHDHHHHDHHHHDHHHHDHGGTLHLQQEILARNNRLAERNRGWLAGRGIVALNLVSSPGSGKTTLLERTLRDLGGEMSFQIVEGDQATDNDARRIQQAGGRVVQVNTGTGCHLEASMLARSLEQLDPPPGCVLMIENVGNLVCPALFDLGERAKVLIVSVTEGEDKPLKYPHMFRAAALLVLNKIDLLPHVQFDAARFLEYARQVNPRQEVLQLSATRGDGLEPWYAWLRGQRQQRPSLEGTLS